MPKEQVRDIFKARLENELVTLAGVDPDDTRGLKRSKADRELGTHEDMLGELQMRLFAEQKQSLLIVLQALDTGGKDGTIKHAMSGLNPQGVQVVGFKQPTKVEAAHHFLWRIRPHVPSPGCIVIFNRSHYEDVLVPLVKGTRPESVIRRRYQEINAFERALVKGGTQVVKLMLHISFEEQRERLKARLLDPTKRWKFKPEDLIERGYWDAYQAAYDKALTATSTDYAPWYVLPADHKWFRNWAVSHILIETLTDMNPQYPKLKLDVPALLKKLEPEPLRPRLKKKPSKKGVATV